MEIFGAPQKDDEENKSNKEERVPDWVKHFIKEKNGGDGDQNDREWNKVMIMDPPTLIWQNKEAGSSSCQGFHSGSKTTANNWSSNVSLRYR